MADRLSPLDASFLFMEESTTADARRRLDDLRATRPDFDPDRFVALIGERLAARSALPAEDPRGARCTSGCPCGSTTPTSSSTTTSAAPPCPPPARTRSCASSSAACSVAPARPGPAAVGDLPGRGAVRRPVRDRHQDPPRDGRRAVVDRHRHGAAGRHARPRGSPRRTTGAPRRSRRPRARRRRRAGAAARPAADVRQTARAGACSTSSRSCDTGGAMLAAARSASRPAPANPLNAPIGQQRRYGTSAGALDDYKAIRKEHGGTVNDVVLTVVTGALRRWMTTRGEPVLRRHDGARDGAGERPRPRARAASWATRSRRTSSTCPSASPTPSPASRPITAAMAGHKSSGQAIGASALVGLVGLATPTLHSLGARLTSSMSSRMFNVVVTNVPGPQFPLYAMGARMRDMYPVVPLAKGQAVSIGITQLRRRHLLRTQRRSRRDGGRRRARRRDRCEPRRAERADGLG